MAVAIDEGDPAIGFRDGEGADGLDADMLGALFIGEYEATGGVTVEREVVVGLHDHAAFPVFLLTLRVGILCYAPDGVRATSTSSLPTASSVWALCRRA